MNESDKLSDESSQVIPDNYNDVKVKEKVRVHFLSVTAGIESSRITHKFITNWHPDKFMLAKFCSVLIYPETYDLFKRVTQLTFGIDT